MIQEDFIMRWVHREEVKEGWAAFRVKMKQGFTEVGRGNQ